jgi:uncharacterized protein
VAKRLPPPPRSSARPSVRATKRSSATARWPRRRKPKLRAQARQITLDKRVAVKGEIEYRYPIDGAIRSLLVDDATRRQLANGQLVIVRFDDGVAVLPRLAADKVRERAPELIVLDNRSTTDTESTAGSSEDDAYYAQFTVPDDLVW